MERSKNGRKEKRKPLMLKQIEYAQIEAMAKKHNTKMAWLIAAAIRQYDEKKKQRRQAFGDDWGKDYW